MSINLKKYKRWTVKRKFEVVISLLNEHTPLDALSLKRGRQPMYYRNGKMRALSKGMPYCSS